VTDPQTTSATPARPFTLTLAAGLAGLQALALVVLAALELTALTDGRLTMGLTTALAFGLLGAALAFCVWSVWNGRSWGRAPIMLAELIQLGLAWSFRDDTVVALALAAYALVVIGALLAPSSVAALEEE
jgi:hypothetical protein